MNYTDKQIDLLRGILEDIKPGDGNTKLTIQFSIRCVHRPRITIVYRFKVGAFNGNLPIDKVRPVPVFEYKDMLALDVDEIFDKLKKQLH